MNEDRTGDFDDIPPQIRMEILRTTLLDPVRNSIFRTTMQLRAMRMAQYTEAEIAPALQELTKLEAQKVFFEGQLNVLEHDVMGALAGEAGRG